MEIDDATPRLPPFSREALWAWDWDWEVCSCPCAAEYNFLNNKNCFVFDKQKRAGGEWPCMPAIYKNRQANKQIDA